MSQEKTVEQRLLCLEDAVADLQSRVAALTPGNDWLKPVSRSAEELEAMEEAYELGRAWRESQGMPEDQEAAPTTEGGGATSGEGRGGTSPTSPGDQLRGEFMPKDKTVEQRLLSLEDAVADLRRRVAALTPGGNWLEQVAGSMKDVEGFEEMCRLGREWRESQGMPEDEETAS